ncbi:probable phenylalanine--tRNA ligase, mitochondrial [Cephus cinctus]|uniref:Phenylalanine--tRNA ligase, mitochondrial n=1 Tax=Cephus cinctus TaxID=211228 RepID=A0AAJ7CFY2_CEPCN|nr:probable phenylalanine--tRNA ligase, mitochondrial [Cephus cinctus]XP_024947574.1 probable phenylalanine--tRNA ligase, mitochondrial [Cephus cinctus]
MTLPWFNMVIFAQHCKRFTVIRTLSTAPKINKFPVDIELLGQKYPTDDWTNLTPKIVSALGKNLHTMQYHPLSHVRQRIVNYFYKSFVNRIGNPIFSVHDNISPIVTVTQNFDSLMIPKDHVSRNKSDCYYVNQDILLRAHTTAHQSELISMGLNNFLVIGDVYRRDEIDATHYPIFHQADAVRLCTSEEVFQNVKNSNDLKLFEHRGHESSEKQGCHSLEAVKIMEHELKTVLIGLVKAIFGKEIKYQWVDQYFPFTHPSWELEVFYNDKWVEVLGCGIMRQEILQKSGASDRIGWAFGLGLERLAMCLYNIPDIRLFWSTDSGFLKQFEVNDPDTPIIYKPVSIYPQCCNDMSFWIPQHTNFTPTDFYDLVREIGGDTVEQITLIDQFVHPKTKKVSHCYRIVYRHMERTLTQKEVNNIHEKIADIATQNLNVVIR